jgi:hypothetical protein
MQHQYSQEKQQCITWLLFSSPLVWFPLGPKRCEFVNYFKSNINFSSRSDWAFDSWKLGLCNIIHVLIKFIFMLPQIDLTLEVTKTQVQEIAKNIKVTFENDF